MATYTENTPQGSQQIATTQPLILGNFEYLDGMLSVDHNFTGTNPSTGDGLHNKLSMPDTGSDITSLVPGATLVQYVLGNILYAWDGAAKQSISSISAFNTITLTGSLTPIVTLPANCIGVIFFSQIVDMSLNGYGVPFIFMTSGGVGWIQNFSQYASGSTQIIPSIVNASRVLNVRTTLSSFNTTYKYIYWPI